MQHCMINFFLFFQYLESIPDRLNWDAGLNLFIASISVIPYMSAYSLFFNAIFGITDSAILFNTGTNGTGTPGFGSGAGKVWGLFKASLNVIGILLCCITNCTINNSWIDSFLASHLTPSISSGSFIANS